MCRKLADPVIIKKERKIKSKKENKQLLKKGHTVVTYIYREIEWNFCASLSKGQNLFKAVELNFYLMPFPAHSENDILVQPFISL